MHLRAAIWQAVMEHVAWWSATFILPLVVYITTAAPTIYALDSSEFAREAYVLGVAHPPGYPLYLLLGKLFITLVPIGDVGYRMNIMSAVFGAAAISTVYVVLARCGVRRELSALTALLLAFSYYCWAQATMAEVYTLHNLLVALILLLLIEWRRRRRFIWLATTALICGLSLGNHLAAALLLPGVAYFVFRTDREVIGSGPKLARTALPFVIGLGIYAYVPLRSDMETVGELVDFVTARLFWESVLAYSAPELLGQALAQLHWLWASFLGVGLVLGVIGCFVCWDRDATLAGTLLLMLGANVLFFIGYRVADKELMLGHVYLLWALLIGYGVDRVSELAEQVVPARRAGLFAVRALYALAVLVLLVVNYPRADLSDDWRVRVKYERMLSSLEPQAVLVLHSWVDIMPLKYLQAVEGQRADVRLIDLQAEADEAERLALLLASMEDEDRPLYATEPSALEHAQYSQQWLADCNCYRLRRKPSP